MSRFALIAALVTAGLLAATPAHADRPPLYFSVGYAAQVVTDRSYDFVDGDDHLPLFRVSAGYSFQLAPGTLDVDASWRTGGTSAVLHQNLRSGLWLRGVEVGGTFRYPLLTKLEPYGRLAAAWDWATLEVNGAQLRETQSGLGATAQVGLQGRFPLQLKQPAVFILDVGVGYTLRPAYGFHELRPEAPDKPSPEDIPQAGVNVGSLPLSGISYALSVGVHL